VFESPRAHHFSNKNRVFQGYRDSAKALFVPLFVPPVGFHTICWTVEGCKDQRRKMAVPSVLDSRFQGIKGNHGTRKISFPGDCHNTSSGVKTRGNVSRRRAGAR
jgi:hypothetical protein